MTLRLILEQAPHRQSDTERTFSGGTLVIGRSDEADWQLSDPDMFLSRRHAIVSEQDGQVVVTDASSGGLYVDNSASPIGTGNAVPVEPGMRLRLGDFVIRVEGEGAAAPSPPAPGVAPNSAAGGMTFGFDFGEPGPRAEPPPRPASLPDPFGTRPDAPSRPMVEDKVPPRPLDQADPFALDLQQGRGHPAAPAPPASPTGPDFFSGPSPRQQEGTAMPQGDASRARVRDPFASPPGSAPGGDGPAARDPFGDDAFGAGPGGAVPPDPSAARPSAPRDPFADASAAEQARPPASPSAPPSADADIFGLGPPQAAPDWPARPEAFADPPPRTPPAFTQPPGGPPAAAGAPDAPPERLTPAFAPEPAPQPPRPVPAAVSPDAPPSLDADAEALRAALFRGLGIDPARAETDDPVAQMELVGAQLRGLAEGVMLLLRARAEEKNRARVAQTLISNANVNPLKFVVTADDAVAALIGPERQGYLAPRDAVGWAFRDLADHQMRTWTALQTSLRRMIDKFDPAEIEREMEETGVLERLLAGGRSAKLWQLYTERYSEIADAAEEQFLGEVGPDFRTAYETRGGS